MNNPRKSPANVSRSDLPSWTALAFGLALAVLPSRNASAQLALDKVHGYAIDGSAAYTASGTGHTGLAGDSAMDLGTGGGSLLTVTDPAFLSSLNASTANNTLSVSFWAKLYQISAASAFYFYSPSSSGTGRGFQAHLPWSDDNIYFDTDGCCDGGAQRISASITGFAPYIAAGGTDSWWNNWHHFVFLKNGNDKQVWIDGLLFLEGSSTGPLPSDFNLMEVGSGIFDGVAGSLEGQIDDFAVFGSGLSSNNVQSLFTGTTPDSLTGVNLLAYWNFNVTKPILNAIQAGPGATGVSPDISAYYVLANGTTAVQSKSIKLAINGTDVTGALTILTNAVPPVVEGTTAGATIYYTSTNLFDSGSTQRVTLVYSDNATPPNVFSNTWPVVIEAYNGYVTDSQYGHVGFLEGSAVFTLDKGGHTGKAGDRAIDLEGLGSGGDVHVGSANFLNVAGASNTLSVSMWMKMHRISAGGAVFARSVSSSGGEQGFAALPWSDDNIYFDTAGCCDLSAQRVVAAISSLPAYVDDSFWTSWHNYVFIYNNNEKDIWIDGVQLTSGSSFDSLPTDFADMFFGYDPYDNAYQQALIDDVAVYGTALSTASISALTNGASPTALTGETLLAYWDFNTISPGPPFVSLASTPAPGSTNAPPDVQADILIVNRNTAVQESTIKLSFDGSNVTSSATITTNSAGATVTYDSPTLLPALSSHSLTVVFSDNATPPNFVSNTWSFVVGPYGAYSRDALHSYLALFEGSTHFTPDGGGHTGKPGDRAIDLGTDGAGGATVADPPFLSAVNAAAGLDTLSVSFWLKQSAVVGESVFWFNSPSVGRDFQAHCPWSDDTIYFDTGGCCDATANRISANINTFAAWSGSDVFWASWHHFVFLKNGEDKQIYIDGQLFLDASNTATLATDISGLWIANAPGVGSAHGQMDDFAVFGDALSSANITALAGGVSPSTLGDPNLLAFWGFEDVGPAFISSRSPVPNATGVAAFGPTCRVTAVMIDGSTKVNPSSLRLDFNGVDVTGKVVLSNPAPGMTQVEYAPAMLASGSSNWVTLVFSDNATPPNTVSNTWSFIAENYTGETKDILHGYVGLLQPAAIFTPNGGGHTGLPGDYAIDTTVNGGPVHIDDATFLYPAETNDTMTFSFWCKKYDIVSSSAFWVNSPSSSGGGRGFQTHLPWSNDNIYFDTSGCCDGNLQRISADINTFPGYTNDGFWTNWHHYVFLYNAGDKQIWIDGVQFLDGNSSSPLALDFTDMFLGRDVGDNANMHGLIDDFAAFSTPVTASNIALLATGTLPTALTGETILAYWNFNDAPTNGPKPTISIAAAGGKVVITYTGTLQSSSAVPGTYADVTGASSPYTVPTTGRQEFYRARQ